LFKRSADGLFQDGLDPDGLEGLSVAGHHFDAAAGNVQELGQVGGEGGVGLAVLGGGGHGDARTADPSPDRRVREAPGTTFTGSHAAPSALLSSSMRVS